MNTPIDNVSLRQLNANFIELTRKKNIEQIVSVINKNTKYHAMTESTTIYNFIFPKKNPISQIEQDRWWACKFTFNTDQMNILYNINNIPDIIEKLQTYFPECIIVCKSYNCSSGLSSITCKCKDHTNCISIDWSKK